MALNEAVDGFDEPIRKVAVEPGKIPLQYFLTVLATFLSWSIWLRIAQLYQVLSRPSSSSPNGGKANSVYMSQYQLLPYNRIENHFLYQMQIPVSAGSIFNFNKEDYDRLEPFEQWARTPLVSSRVIDADETGINIGGKRNWLHNASNLLENGRIGTILARH